MPWDAASGRLLRSLEGHTGMVTAIAFSPDGTLLASKSDDNSIRLWSCATWEKVAVIEPHETGVAGFVSWSSRFGDSPRRRALRRKRDIGTDGRQVFMQRREQLLVHGLLGEADRLVRIVLLVIQLGRDDFRPLAFTPEGGSEAIVADAVAHDLSAARSGGMRVLAAHNLLHRSRRVLDVPF
jgi:hypothetical protein